MSINENSPNASAQAKMQEDEKKQKPIPINKYSIYEIKNAIDTKIIEYLEEKKFKENHYLSNLKIFAGLFCLSFTALAYLYPKPFPENYNIVLLSVVMYAIGSIFYYFIEKFLIKQIFYSGFNEEFITKLRQGKREKLKLIQISSEVKDYSAIYQIWFDFTLNDGNKVESEKVDIDCTKLCDERGYVDKTKVEETFKKVLTDQLANKNLP